jgi:hypothetical protein
MKTILLIGLFAFALGYYMNFPATPAAETSYTDAQRAAMDRLVGGVLPAQEVVLFRRDKHAELTRKQAAVYAKVFGITAENINSNIFGEGK